MDRDFCRYCGAPVAFHPTAKGWVHTRPLAEFRLSHRELDAVLADPPPPGQPLIRKTHIHPAQPF